MTTHISPSTSKTGAALVAQDLYCIRGDKELFADLSLELRAGECLHVRGANGVGKTSLLRLLAGLSKPESGEIFWHGKSLSASSQSFDQDRLFLGHRDALKEELSALENLQLYAMLDKLDLSIEKQIAALWRFGLRGRENLPVHYLSAGQKRRVLMARMFMRKASLWILDEPFNALDADAIIELEKLIVDHLATGGMLVLTSHQAITIPHVKALDL